MYTKILLCSDGSEHALSAARHAAELSKKFGSKLVLLNVFNPSAAPMNYIGVPGAALMTATNLGCYAEEIQEAVERDTGKILEKFGVEYVCRRELGHPVERIMAAAADEQVDLIVMGSRGLSEWKSFLLGSISDGVLHHAHCPVLVVR